MKQPKALFLLSVVQMWRFFSHYGIRALLVLFMVDSLRYSDAHAFGVNALFCGLVELSGIFGGVLADRFLGLRRATWLGALVAAGGYSCLVFEQGYFLGLSLIVLGSSLFSGNIIALLGAAYEENDPRRERGFTLFYMMQNLGAFVSTFLCGAIATHYGFRAGFAVAASGMIFAVMTLFLGRGWLKDLGSIPKRKGWWILCVLLIFGAAMAAITYANTMFYVLPWVTLGVFLFFAVKLLRDAELPKEKIRLLFVYLGALILFFAVEDQVFSSLMVFSERIVNRTFFGWTMPSSIMMSINPVLILLFGTLIAKLRFRISIPFLLVGGAFGLIAIVCLQQMNFSIFGVLGVVVMLSIAELMIGPMVFSYASEVATSRKAGMVMGMVPISFSLAFLLSGHFSKMVAVEENVSSLTTYGIGFGKIALIVLVGGIVLEFLMKRFSYAQKRPVS